MPEPVFTRVHLPRPVFSDTVTNLLTRLMGSDVPRPVVFEVHASSDGINHVMGCAPTAVQRLKRLLRDHLPGVAFEAATRADVAAVSRVVAHPAVLPLAETDPEQVTAAIYQALAARRGQEHVAIQLILGRAHGARPLSPKAADPFQQVVGVMLDGVRPAAGETRKRMEHRSSTPTLSVTLRIGVTADSHKRTVALIWEVWLLADSCGLAR